MESEENLGYTSYQIMEDAVGAKPTYEQVLSFLLTAEADKPTAGRYGITDEQRAQLAELVSEITGSDAYLEQQRKHLADERERRFEKFRTIPDGNREARHRAMLSMDEVSRTSRNLNNARSDEGRQGILRSLPNCSEQVQDIQARIPEETLGDIYIEPARGIADFAILHELLMVLPSKDHLEEIRLGVDAAKKDTAIAATLSLDTLLADNAPAVGDVVVIDPTAIQAYDVMGDLDRVRFSRRLDHFERMSKGNTTKTGVFLGTFAEYMATMTSQPIGAREIELEPLSFVAEESK